MKTNAPCARRSSAACGGCSKDPVSLLRDMGVDMRTPAPVNDALSLFGELIDELSELLG